MKLEDRLIDKFYSSELNPIRSDNRYHSPEVSETDDDDPENRKIVVRDLKWRSSTVSFISNNRHFNDLIEGFFLVTALLATLCG